MAENRPRVSYLLWVSDIFGSCFSTSLGQTCLQLRPIPSITKYPTWTTSCQALPVHDAQLFQGPLTFFHVFPSKICLFHAVSISSFHLPSQQAFARKTVEGDRQFRAEPSKNHSFLRRYSLTHAVSYPRPAQSLSPDLFFSCDSTQASALHSLWQYGPMFLFACSVAQRFESSFMIFSLSSHFAHVLQGTLFCLFLGGRCILASQLLPHDRTQ